MQTNRYSVLCTGPALLFTFLAVSHGQFDYHRQLVVEMTHVTRNNSC